VILDASDLNALFITFKLAFITTTILLVLGTPLAWWLSRTSCRYKFLIEAVVALPLVLPPTVIGFYLLIALGEGGVIGSLSQFLGLGSLAFTFTGLVIGSVFYSLPFVVQPLQSAFVFIDQKILDAASTLRASKYDQFLTIIFPLAKPGFLTAAILGFAHTLGEFGVVLMIGGNIAGETQVASVAIYEHVESLQYAQAHTLSLILLLFSFVTLALIYAFNRRFMVGKI